jgi:hypothetical protein
MTLDSVAPYALTGRDASGKISLRSANATACADIVIVPVRLFRLLLPGANEDRAVSGDLDITGRLTIRGAGTARTIIDAQSLDRVMHIHTGQVQISKLTLRNGSAFSGGGLFIESGQVTLNQVNVTNNLAQGGDGVDGMPGTSSFPGAPGASATGTAGGGGGSAGQSSGGGIFVRAGSLSLMNSSVSMNTVRGGFGGVGVARSGACGQSGGAGEGGTVGVGGKGGNARIARSARQRLRRRPGSSSDWECHAESLECERKHRQHR